MLRAQVKKDVRTKNLIPRLQAGNIALIDHEDLDRVSAEALRDSGVSAVLNTASFISGEYPNTASLELLSAGIILADQLGRKLFDEISEDDELLIRDTKLYRRGEFLAELHILTAEEVIVQAHKAKIKLDSCLDDFTRNTLSYLEEDRDILLGDMWVPPTEINLKDRHVLVVIRGHEYKNDLRALKSYISEMNPVLLAVDGAADALACEGYAPDIIIGDMDSVSDELLQSGAQLIAHAYPDGSCPALERLAKLGLKADTWPLSATSEDLALLLAYHSQASLIVAVGSHVNLIEYLDKGRGGMSSTFLVRLKVGERLVDAKGVSKLYRSVPSFKHLGLVSAAALFSLASVIVISPQLRSALALLWLSVKHLFS